MTGVKLAADAGISQGFLSEVENGKRRLSHSTMEKLAAAVGRAASEFQRELMAIAAEHPPAALSEPAAVYHVPRADDCSDFEELASFLAARLDRAEIIAMIHKFTDLAAAGDASAGRRAKALLELLNR